MPMTARDILHNADLYRAAYPDYGRWPQPVQDTSDPQQAA